MDSDNDVVMRVDGSPTEALGDVAVTVTNGNGVVSYGDLEAGFLDGELPNGDEDDSESGRYDDDFEEYDPRAFPDEMKRVGQLPTGCCYDDRMKLHANADFGATTHHPEDPARIEAIFRTFKLAELVFTGSDAELVEAIATNPTKYMWRIHARKATKDEILTTHQKSHYDWVESLSTQSTAELRDLTKKLDQGRDSLYVGSMTHEAALISAGGAIETCMAVVRGDVKNAIAVIRPPGHHAEYDAPMGFCLFNNVPIAARVCQQQFPDTCRKVLILDWDVHHGNGIQNIFYNEPNVLYISIHVYQNGEFYPGRNDNPMIPDGGIGNCGRGPGLGKNINIGWHDQGMGDGEYMAAFQRIVMPIAQEFDPDLVIVSAGFDAADGDQLGGCFVTPTCYAHMTHMLMSLAGGKVAVCLEGGYNLKAISQSALAVARTLMGEPPGRFTLPNINREAAHVLYQVQAHQAPFWKCMRPGIMDIQDPPREGVERLHDVIRDAQRLKLSMKFGMVPLHIQRNVLFKSYENQVLVTPDLDMAQKILVIIHDPPELLAQPDPLDNTVDPHNSWVDDGGVFKYIEWAVNEKFGIIDINVPKYITRPEDVDPFTPSINEAQMQQQIQEVSCYIWDNYLQLSDSVQDVFLLGVGNSYLGIKVLLTNRECKSKISGVVSFVNGNLRPVKSDFDIDLSNWYFNNSLILVGHDHACFQNPELNRKVKKQRRYGNVVQSNVNSLNLMMKEHSNEVSQWIKERTRCTKVDGNTTEEDD